MHFQPGASFAQGCVCVTLYKVLTFPTESGNLLVTRTVSQGLIGICQH